MGAKVIAIQIMEHERLGVIDYEWPRSATFWPEFWSASREARGALGELHERVANKAPGADGTRSLSYDFVAPAIVAHAQMVICAVLAMRYLVLELERWAGLAPPTGATDDLDRFRRACVGAGLDDPAEREQWAEIGELVATRHRIEHPTQDTIYSRDHLDRVPLAWSLTKRALNCFDAFDLAFGEIADTWDEHKATFSKPGTLQVAARGLRARRPAKNPPKPSATSDPQPPPRGGVWARLRRWFGGRSGDRP